MFNIVKGSFVSIERDGVWTKAMIFLYSDHGEIRFIVCHTSRNKLV